MSDSATKEVNLSAGAQKVLEAVEKLTVLELADLVKAMEEKFGVSAAAPVAIAGVAPAGGGEGGGEAPEKDTFDVILTNAGQAKIAVIKAVREATGLGLKEAKDVVDAAPKAVKEGIKKDAAEELKAKLEEAGASVEIK